MVSANYQPGLAVPTHGLICHINPIQVQSLLPVGKLQRLSWTGYLPARGFGHREYTKFRILKISSSNLAKPSKCVTLKVNHSYQSPLAPEILDEKAEDLDDLSGPLRRLVMVVVALVMAIILSIAGLRHIQASDPYIQAVLAIDGDRTRGEAIFKMNCAVCHGINGSGEVGPNLLGVSDHKTKVNLIQQVTSGRTPPMPQFQPDPESMADLLTYLEKL